MKPLTLACLVGMFAAAAAPLQGATGEVVLASGERFQGELQGITPDWQIAFAAGLGPKRTIAAKELAYWGAYSDNLSDAQIVLADGGVLCVHSILAWNGQGLQIESRLWGEMRLPLDAIRGVIFEPPADPLVRDRLLRRIRTAEGRSDRLLLTNGDELACVVMEANNGGNPVAVDPIPAILKVRPSGATEPIELPGERVTAVLLNPALIRVPVARGLYAAIGFRNGDLLYTAEATVRSDAREEGPLAQIDLVGGVQLSTDYRDFVYDACSLQVFGGETTWLSDLQSAAYRHTPFLDLSWPFETDRNVLGGKLRSGRSAFLKGLGMHSRSRVAFALGERYESFAAELAIDQQAGQRGSVIFRVYANREGAWSPIYQSPVVRGGQPPTPVQLDITGAAALLLIVDFADRGDELDYADWLNARVR